MRAEQEQIGEQERKGWRKTAEGWRERRGDGRDEKKKEYRQTEVKLDDDERRRRHWGKIRGKRGRSRSEARGGRSNRDDRIGRKGGGIKTGTLTERRDITRNILYFPSAFKSSLILTWKTSLPKGSILGSETPIVTWAELFWDSGSRSPVHI